MQNINSNIQQQQVYGIYVGKKSLTLNNLSTHQYAEAIQLYTILSECTKIFLRKTALSPSQTIAQYLSQCNKGEHVLLKSFSSFNKSSINRICFLHNFIKIFELENHQRNGIDYYQLFRLLCSDFPRDIVVKSVNLVVQDKQTNNQTKNMNKSIDANMTKIVNSRKFINSLFMNFIHFQYLQGLYNEVFQGKNQSVVITLLAQWIWQKQKNMFKIHQKPLFSALVQALLNLIRKKNTINQMSTNYNFPSAKDLKRVVFVNEKNCLDFIRSQYSNQGTTKITKKSQKQNKFKDSSDQDDEGNRSSSLKNSKKNQIDNNTTKIFYEQFLREIINQVEYHKWIKQNLQMFENSIIWAVETYKVLSAKQTGDVQPLNQKKMKKK